RGGDAGVGCERRTLRRTDPSFAFASPPPTEADLAAGSPRADPTRRAVVLGNVFGPSGAVEAAVRTADDEGVAAVPPSVGLLASTSSAAATVAQRVGARGPVSVVAGACAAATHALGQAAALVATGAADVAWAGGTEGPVAPTLQAAYGNLRALSPTGWVRPFDRRRDGFVFGLGAAVLVLEPLDDARARGATVLGEVAGWANTNDASHAVRPSGDGAVECMGLALERAGVAPGAVAHVNAHGTGTQANDAAEAAAVATVCGAHRPPMTSIKRVTGHGVGAAGALEAVIALRGMAEALLPPSGIEPEPDPDIDADVVWGSPRDWEPGPVVSNSFGIGGFNGSIVLLPPDWRSE
ncbi:MAG: beta-ketoacyl-[acyl-carrier-protein] synthase family protein, partial [Iamia sp.]